MKNKKASASIIVVVAFILATIQSFAGNSSDSLKLANDFYAKKQYEKALPIYLALNKSGYESTTLYYNTGCAYFKTNNFVKAILFFERALVLDPNNDDIKFNLEVARTNQVDKLDVIPDFFLTNWVKYVAGIFSSNTWALYGVLFFIITLSFLFLFFFATAVTSKRTYFSLAILILLFSSISLWFSSIQKERMTVRTTAIVITPSITAKSSPDDAGTDLFLIHEGLKVTVIEKVAGWIKIKLSNGSVGWLKKSDIEVI